MGRTHWLAFSTGSRDKISKSESRWSWWHQRHDHQTKGMRNTDFSRWKPHDLYSVLNPFRKEHRRDDRLQYIIVVTSATLPHRHNYWMKCLDNWGERKKIFTTFSGIWSRSFGCLCCKSVQTNGWNINFMRIKELHSKLQVARKKMTLFHTFSYVTSLTSLITFWEPYMLLLLVYQRLLSCFNKMNGSLMQLFCQQNCITVSLISENTEKYGNTCFRRKKGKILATQ